MRAVSELSERPALSEAPASEPNSGAGLDELRFREYRLLPAARILLKGRTPVAIGSRAFDILHVLLEARGCIVGKREIVKSVWPTTIVEESNLRFQVAQLRKALGDDQDLIKTIPGRGYLFALHPNLATFLEPVQEIEVLEVDTGGGGAPVPLLHLQAASYDEPQPAAGRICAEARILLQRLLDSLEVKHGGAVILYVRFAD